MKKIFLILIFAFFAISCSHSEPGLGDPLVSGIFSRNFKAVKHELSEEKYKKDYSKKYSTYKEFLDHRLNKNFDLHGKTPILWACLANYKSEKQLKKVEEKRLEIIKFLVEKGSTINVKDKQGWTPLIWASWSGMDKIVAFLIEKGADVNAKTDKGWTALMAASLRGYDKVVKILVEKNADKTLKNVEGKTALDIAKQHLKMNPSSKEKYIKVISYLK